jgi:hypothetical protein
MCDNQTKFISKQRPISSVCKSISRRTIDLCPSWQRNVVWNTRMQKELIMTILKGFPINPIVVWQVDHGTKEVCVDGKNRLSAIHDFVNCKFTVCFNGRELKFDDLPDKVKDDFNDENLDIRILTGSYWNETKVREYFQVIQGGSKLTWPEIINSFNSKYVDFMRDVMLNTQQCFEKVLGNDCNSRFELYNIIANVFSVHPIIYNQYNTQKNKPRTADTNKSLMKYVMNFEKFVVNNEQVYELNQFLLKTIDVIESLHTMQQKEVTPLNKSIWFLTETDTNLTRVKPGIRDFTSVAYYITVNEQKEISAVTSDLKCVFKTFLTTVRNPAKHHVMIQLIHEYYIVYGKNQKQYAWSSVSKRYDIMKEVLEHTQSHLIDL